MQETQVQSLAQEEPLEKEVTTFSSILAWEIPWTEELGGLQTMVSQKLDITANSIKHILGCILKLWLLDGESTVRGRVEAERLVKSLLQ